MRLDANPAPGGTIRPFGWGFAFDTDDDASDYEALLILDGQTGTVALFRNSTTTVANSPADPADQPPLSTGGVTQRSRAPAASSNFGGTGDNFLDLAVSWADLSAVGITPTTPVRVWVGTSQTGDRLDDDIACHDGTGGAPRLSDVASVRVTLDPNAPGGGADGGVGQTHAVEGGPGCACAFASTGTGGLLPLLMLLLVGLRSRRG
jgi:MYXO-CTERM domain-containing protein